MVFRRIFRRKDEEEELYQLLAQVGMIGEQFKKKAKERERQAEKLMDELSKVVLVKGESHPETRHLAARAVRAQKNARLFMDLGYEFIMMADDIETAIGLHDMSVIFDKISSKLRNIFSRGGFKIPIKPFKGVEDIRQYLGQAIQMISRQLEGDMVNVEEEDITNAIELAKAKATGRHIPREKKEKPAYKSEEVDKLSDIEKKLSDSSGD